MPFSQTLRRSPLGTRKPPQHPLRISPLFSPPVPRTNPERQTVFRIESEV